MRTRTLRRHRVLAAVAAFVLCSATPAVAVTTLCVNPGGTAGCFSSIQGAIDSATGSVEVDIAAGAYLENVEIATGRVSLRGAGSDSTIVDGKASGSVISIGFGQLGVAGLTLQNGAASLGGGLFVGRNARATVRDSRIAQNQAVEGGGVYSLGSLTLLGTTLESNAAQRGGAISLGSLFGSQGGRAKITGGSIKDNTATGAPVFPLGSAVLVSKAGVLELNGVAVVDNTGDAHAAAIDALGKARVTIKRSTISGSSENGVSASAGALLKIVESTLEGNAGAGAATNGAALMQIERSTVSANGTGVDIDADRATVSTCTISGNGVGIVATAGPSSISNSTVATNSGFGILTNFPGVVAKATILAKNNPPVGPDCQGGLQTQGWNLVERVGLATCTYFPAPAMGDLTGVDPLLGPLQGNGGPTQTQALLGGSPALSAAGGSACSKADQRGTRRHRPCDIGAFEAP